MTTLASYPAITPSTEFQFTSRDGLNIASARGDSHGPMRGVVQIAHGMGEHIGCCQSPAIRRAADSILKSPAGHHKASPVKRMPVSFAPQ